MTVSSPKAPGKTPAELLAEARTAYENDSRSGKINVLLLGRYGSGKTFLARTMPGPVLIDCFDPGGTIGLQPQIESGTIIADTRWSQDDPLRPTVFTAWLRAMNERIQAGLFDTLGTYVLDSTTFLDATIMNEVMRKAGLPGSEPRGKDDYIPAKAALTKVLRQIANLPCHTVVTGHLKDVKDREGNLLRTQFLVIGDGAERLPALFDEVWIMAPKRVPKSAQNPDGLEYRIQTQPDGMLQARSRLAGLGKLSMYEPADFTAVLQKSGRQLKNI